MSFLSYTLDKQQTNFCVDGRRAKVIRPNQKIRMTTTKRSRYYAVFHDTINKPPIHEAYTFVEKKQF